MDWIQFAIFLITMMGMYGSLIAMCFWSRAESLADNRLFHQEMRSFHNAIQQEMKDFHGRLCTLEEKYLQIITKK